MNQKQVCNNCKNTWQETFEERKKYKDQAREIAEKMRNDDGEIEALISEKRMLRDELNSELEDSQNREKELQDQINELIQNQSFLLKKIEILENEATHNLNHSGADNYNHFEQKEPLWSKIKEVSRGLKPIVEKMDVAKLSDNRTYYGEPFSIGRK